MKGLIFIPDISGFTNFVKKIDIELGMSITRDLLTEIIEKNPLDLEIAEIEGDAVLFYKIGQPIAIESLLHSFKRMMESFDKKYRELSSKYGIETDLSLKLIVHYGTISSYTIKGFTKLYGQTVIEAHRLLKNGAHDSGYILITDQYFDALEQDVDDVALPNWVHSQHECRYLKALVS
jgi:hypothetical protein